MYWVLRICVGMGEKCYVMKNIIIWYGILKFYNEYIYILKVWL